MKRAVKREKAVRPARPFGLHKLIADGFPEKFDIKTVYHYTSSQVAQLLLNPETAMLYCTWVKALNDEQEYRIGLEYALSHIAEVMGLSQEVLSEVKDMVMLYEKDDYRIPWVMSFSANGDLLGQWRAYTDQQTGGYAVGFSFKKLEALVERIVVDKSRLSKGERMPYILHLLPCFYLDYSSKTAMDDLAKFFKLIFVDHFNCTVKGLVDVRDPHQYAFAIATFICIFASVVKNASFSGEQEYRLMMQLRDKKYARNVEIVGGKPRLRISQKIPSRAIQEHYHPMAKIF